MTHRRTSIGLVALMVVLVSPACAEQADSPDDAIKLGPIQGFSDEATARAACRPDGVVWADRKSGFYYPKFAPEYGVGRTGSFACYKQAKAADYWSIGGTLDSMGSRRTRIFPVRPEPFCDYKVDRATGKGFCAQPGV